MSLPNLWSGTANSQGRASRRRARRKEKKESCHVAVCLVDYASYLNSPLYTTIVLQRCTASLRPSRREIAHLYRSRTRQVLPQKREALSSPHRSKIGLQGISDYTLMLAQCDRLGRKPRLPDQICVKVIVNWQRVQSHRQWDEREAGYCANAFGKSIKARSGKLDKSEH